MLAQKLYAILTIYATFACKTFAYRRKRFIFVENSKLLGHIFNVTTDPSNIQCCAECTNHPACLAVNYNPTTGKCQFCDEAPVKYRTQVEVNAEWNMYHVPGPCNDGWIYYGMSCYWLEITLASQPASAANCASLGAHLLEIADQQENDFALAVYQEAGLWKAPWHGMNDIAIEGTFVWASGAPVTFMNLGPGEGINDVEDCMRMIYNGMWADLNCNTRLEHSMCEMELL